MERDACRSPSPKMGRRIENKVFLPVTHGMGKLILDYESHSGKKFDGDERIATVTHYAPKSCSQAVQLAAMQGGDVWLSFREGLIRALRTTSTYGPTGLLQDPNAMDVGGIGGKMARKVTRGRIYHALSVARQDISGLSVIIKTAAKQGRKVTRAKRKSRRLES